MAGCVPDEPRAGRRTRVQGAFARAGQRHDLDHGRRDRLENSNGRPLEIGEIAPRSGRTGLPGRQQVRVDIGLDDQDHEQHCNRRHDPARQPILHLAAFRLLKTPCRQLKQGRLSGNFVPAASHGAGGRHNACPARSEQRRGQPRGGCACGRRPSLAAHERRSAVMGARPGWRAVTEAMRQILNQKLQNSGWGIGSGRAAGADEDDRSLASPGRSLPLEILSLRLYTGSTRPGPSGSSSEL
jgi:hypothetical protein